MRECIHSPQQTHEPDSLSEVTQVAEPKPCAISAFVLRSFNELHLLCSVMALEENWRREARPDIYYNVVGEAYRVVATQEFASTRVEG